MGFGERKSQYYNGIRKLPDGFHLLKSHRTILQLVRRYRRFTDSENHRKRPDSDVGIGHRSRHKSAGVTSHVTHFECLVPASRNKDGPSRR